MENKNKKLVQSPEEAIQYLLEWIGENPSREGLKQTPARLMRAYQEYFKGYRENPADYLLTHFEEVEGYREPVLLKGITFYSHCEHHMAPIHGIVNIAYIPNKKIVGISKLARVVESFARRLQIQEKMTVQIANCIQETLEPLGVAVNISGVHHCMLGRGVNLKSTTLITNHFTGLYQNDDAVKNDFKMQC